MTFGIIGFGRFGKLAAKYLSAHASVFVFDKKIGPKRFSSKNIQYGSLQQVASREIVILAVPVSSLRQVLRDIRGFLQPRALVVDVCAVKAKPVQWMKTLLPQSVQILGAHPLFGPDSARNSIKGHRLYLCPVRVPKTRLRHAIRKLKASGLIVQAISPDSHDRMIAETLFLTHYIGRIIALSRLRRFVVSTNSYTDLMEIVKIANNDTQELFLDMWKYNPYAKKTLRRLVEAQKTVFQELT